METKNLHNVAARSTFPSKKCRYKTHHFRTTFGRSDVEKLHAAVARSIFPSQNVQNTPFSDHFWKIRCGKNCMPFWRKAHLQFKMLKTVDLRPLLEDQMWKNGTPLWREAHFQVEMNKSHHSPSTLENQMPKANVQVNMLNNRGSDHFSDAERVHTVLWQTEISNSKCTKHTIPGQLLEDQMPKNCTHFQVEMYKTNHSWTTFGRSNAENCMRLWREAHFQVRWIV